MWSNHKGVTATVAASVLRPLVENEARLGNTQQIRMDSLNLRMKQFQDETREANRMVPIRIHNLSETTDSGESVAFLHGPLIKAAMTRSIMPC